MKLKITFNLWHEPSYERPALSIPRRPARERPGGGPSAFLAFRAVAVEFVPMPQHPEAITTGNLVLGGLDHLALEFDDLPAAQTH